MYMQIGVSIFAVFSVGHLTDCVAADPDANRCSSNVKRSDDSLVQLDTKSVKVKMLTDCVATDPGCSSNVRRSDDLLVQVDTKSVKVKMPDLSAVDELPLEEILEWLDGAKETPSTDNQGSSDRSAVHGRPESEHAHKEIGQEDSSSDLPVEGALTSSLPSGIALPSNAAELERTSSSERQSPFSEHMLVALLGGARLKTAQFRETVQSQSSMSFLTFLIIIFAIVVLAVILVVYVHHGRKTSQDSAGEERSAPLILPQVNLGRKIGEYLSLPLSSRDRSSHRSVSREDPSSSPAPPVAPPPQKQHTPPAEWTLQSRSEAPISAEGECLCEELRVPEGSQCVLAVPSLVDVNPGKDKREYRILDTSGEPLICVSLRSVEDVSDSTSERLVLMGWRGRSELATCKLLLSEGLPQGLIFRPTGQLYAILKEVPDTEAEGPGRLTSNERVFWMSSPSGIPLVKVKGDPQSRKLVITMDTEVGGQKIAAAVVPGNAPKSDKSNLKYKQLRVAPGVDASIVIFACLAVDRLPRTDFNSPSRI
eukprot:CAMPEP_0194493082 /NCGR_PEP_ID=MMETSP0253-20130528/11403_1 /TAXON_ID=2966 /ORGANISM="Noctiluca scintillans" /LENGTH=536 /DNA_ID=CAMNT_0039334021 /DNA_START=21 /DNA_END=1631 /DNA_ORIENTATION=-